MFADQPQFEFKISTSIARKPVLAADAPERRGHGGPFVDPDPAFVVARPGPDHVLELSMHAMMRPHYVLHTRLFVPQTDDLDLGDWAATWAVMAAIRDRPSTATAVSGTPDRPMMIYNCGYEGGASQGHKHVQVFAEPDPGFVLFPEEALMLAAESSGSKAPATSIVQHPTVPFQHFVLPLTEPITPAYLFSVYQRLLAEVRRAHREFLEPVNGTLAHGTTNGTNGANGVNGNGPKLNGTNGVNGANGTNGTKTNGVNGSHANGTNGASTYGTATPERPPPSDHHPPSTIANNVIMTTSWMCMIPRRFGGRDGTGAGSLGMLGLLWLKGAKERAHWTELGMTEHLVWMGLPRE